MKHNYQQIRQTGPDGKNIAEIEIRHPVMPGTDEDKDTKSYGSEMQSNNNKPE